MGRVYLLYYDFRHTRGNHAGMAYLARALHASNNAIRLLKHPAQEYKGGWIFAYLYAVCIAVYLKFVLRKQDEVFFFEYLSGDFGFQDTIAKLLRRWGCQNRMSGIVHLGGEQLLELYQDADGVHTRLNLLDRVLVFGSSLKMFLATMVGYRKTIILTYHYADTEFYRPGERGEHKDCVQVLFLGKLKRNVDQLLDIMRQTEGIAEYHVCGASAWRARFIGMAHVRVYPPLKEDDLRDLMQSCDVNLSVFYDTVGSNAITSTLACGLVQIASHVGSISDYGDASNSFRCENTTDFIAALSKLNRDRSRLDEMREQARKKAEYISLNHFVDFFNSLISQRYNGPEES